VVIVTGATGHIGNVLVRELLAAGMVVHALVLPKDDKRPLAGLNLEIVYGDVTDSVSLRSASCWCIVTIIPGMASVLDRVNMGGMCSVIAACRASDVRRLVYTSSIHAIAEPPHGTVIDESQHFDPEPGSYRRLCQKQSSCHTPSPR